MRTINRKLLIAIVGFFGIMLLLTILSRVVASFSVVEVQVITASSQIITHKVEAETTTIQQQEIPVRTEQNQVIEALFVAPGDWVEADAPLFKLSLSDLASSIQQLESEQALIQERINLLYNQIAVAWQTPVAAPVQPGQESDDENELAAQPVQATQTSGERALAIQELELQLTSAIVERDRIALELDGLYALRSADGMVHSPTQGQLVSVNLRVGEQTSKNAVMVLTDEAAGSRAVFTIPTEQGAYFTADTTLTVMNAASRALHKDAPILSITVNPTDADLLNIAVSLPSDTMPIGSRVIMELIISSQTYGSCIPLAALHQSANNQWYVYVVDEENTILGTESYARRVNVTLADKDNSFAAVESGLAPGQEVIVGSNKMLNEQDRILVADG